MRLVNFALLLSLFPVVDATAATIQASSCSRDAVLSAVNSARDGDIVVIPAGNCTWNSTVSISDKSITLQGAGIDRTVITDGIPGVDNAAKPRMFEWFTKNSGGVSRLTGFTFHGGNSGGNDGYNSGHILIAGNSRQLRVDHNKFVPTRSAMVFFRGNLGGVVDHNTIQLSRGWFKFGFYAMHESWNGSGNYGDAAWAADTNFGSADFLFFEDNTFQNDDGHMYATDGWNGARVVYRRNTYVNSTWANHGTETGGRVRSMRAYEVYQNRFVVTGPGSDGSIGPFLSAIGSRGGVGLVFDNSVTSSNGGGFVQFFDVTNLRSFTETWSPTFGHCTGSNPWDQNAGGGGYRCLDQVGAGKGTMISGDDPSPVRWPQQQPEPTYAWRNTMNGANSPTVIRASIIGDNRDSYTENGSFNGSTGVGAGPLGNRPSSCTAGVAYWATDQGEWDSTNGSTPDGRLYKCTSTNNWTLSYTPYQYPHPLVSGSAPTNPIPAPTSPQNVRIIGGGQQ